MAPEGFRVADGGASLEGPFPDLVDPELVPSLDALLEGDRVIGLSFDGPESTLHRRDGMWDPHSYDEAGEYELALSAFPIEPWSRRRILPVAPTFIRVFDAAERLGARIDAQVVERFAPTR